MPGVAQRVGKGIALLFHDRGTRRGWVVSSTPRPHFTPGKDPVPILQEAGWAPGPAWTGGKSRPHRDSIPDRAARTQSLYWLSYPEFYKSFRQMYYLMNEGSMSDRWGYSDPQVPKKLNHSLKQTHKHKKKMPEYITKFIHAWQR